MTALAVGVLAAAPTASAGRHDRDSWAPRDPTVVRIADGTVQGRAEDGYRTFEGIPFAAPPAGDLRFAPPAPVRRWKDTLDATAPRTQCPQIAGGTGNATTIDEDCLHLNVTTPARGRSVIGGKPVMVWIHGGSFLTGTGGTYDASTLATEGDVVVVTINYRLGPLGFLAHPDLSAETPALGSGVAGLLDQQAALRWVKRNIRAFGGNPHNVTIFGESAGGASVCANIASPAVRGLFDRAIAQSYSCTSDLLPAGTAEQIGQGVAAGVGCAAAEDVTACLRDVDVQTLLETWPGGAPAVGGDALPKQPGVALADGTANRVDLMHGNTIDENRLFIPLQYGPRLTSAQYEGAVAAAYPGHVDAVLDRYPVGDYPLPIIALSTVFSDSGSALATCEHVDAYETASDRRWVRTYAYQFQDRTADPLIPVLGGTGLEGAQHATELPYLFPGLFGNGLDEAQAELSAAMVSYWTSFARWGVPFGTGLPRWPAYQDAGDVLALDIAASGGIGTEDVAAASNCAFWTEVGPPLGGDVIAR